MPSASIVILSLVPRETIVSSSVSFCSLGSVGLTNALSILMIRSMRSRSPSSASSVAKIDRPVARAASRPYSRLRSRPTLPRIICDPLIGP